MHELPSRLTERLKYPLPGREAQSKFEPELSFGRHYAPPPPNARRAAVLALLYPQDDAWILPLTVRPTTMTDHAGQVSLPGGMIEPGERSDEAALRELHEELGIGADGIVLLGKLSPLYLFVSNFHVIPWVAVLHEPPELSPSPHEVAEVLEVPIDHLLDPSNVGRHQRSHRGLSYAAPHFGWQAHHIWGATSMILAELVSLVDEVYQEAGPA